MLLKLSSTGSTPQASAATTTWVAAGFDGNYIRFVPGGGNGFTIQFQSLVGGTFVSCDSSIELRRNP